MVETGLLTKSDKEVIENTDEKNPNTRQQRGRMRERVKLGLADFAFLNENARRRDVKQIFNREQTDDRPTDMDIIRGDGKDKVPDKRDSVSKARWVLAYHNVAFLWYGLRLKGMSQDEIFRLVINKGIEQGEAQYEKVDRGSIESDISLNKLKTHRNKSELDPVEKFDRDLALTAEDMQEIHDRLSDHPDVDQIAGEDLNELIERHLIDSDE